MRGIQVSLPLLCPGGANKQTNSLARERKRRSKAPLLSKKMGFISRKYRQSTSCHSLPQTYPSPLPGHFLSLLGVLIKQYFYSMCSEQTLSWLRKYTQVNKVKFFPSEGLCAQAVKEGLPQGNVPQIAVIREC